MNLVSQIHTAIDSLAATTLGGSYVKIRHILNPEKESFRATHAYGVRHGAAANAAGVTRHYTLDHAFELVLLARVVNRDDEETTQTIFNDMYDKADAVLNQMFLTKLGLPSIVLIVDNPSISTPVVLDNDAAILQVGFNVKYRRMIA